MLFGDLACKAYKVFLLFVASNFVRHARIKAGEPGDEAMCNKLPDMTAKEKWSWPLL